MPNRRSKRPQGHRKPKGSPPSTNVVPLHAVPPAKIPKPPAKLLTRTKEVWGDFWASDVSTLVTSSDMYALTRWIKAVDERERIIEAVKKAPMVEGSQGQPVINPLSKRLDAIDAQIMKYEGQFGMTPKARADLGVSAGAAAMTAQKLNEMVEGDEDGSNQNQKGDRPETIDAEAEEVEIEGFEHV